MGVFGIDVSHYQSETFVTNYVNTHDIKFLIAKATEGKTKVDSKFKYFMAFCKETGLLRGAYHYARPDLNDPLPEALNFLETIDDFVSQQDMLLALDWEGKSLNCSDTWAVEWLNIVEKNTGIKPLFYTSSSQTPNMKNVAANGNGLWVADYTAPINSIGDWKFWAIHQYNNQNIDEDVFNGTYEQLLKYAKSSKSPETSVDTSKCWYEQGQKEKCPVWRMLNGME